MLFFISPRGRTCIAMREIARESPISAAEPEPIIAKKKRNYYPKLMAVRTCSVTCRDAQGIEHTVRVTAQSLFEAVAQALRVFREYECMKSPTAVPPASW